MTGSILTVELGTELSKMSMGKDTVIGPGEAVGVAEAVAVAVAVAVGGGLAVAVAVAVGVGEGVGGIPVMLIRPLV